MKYNGTLSKQQINQYTLIDYALMDRYTYYPSPLLVFGSNGYSKHYFIEGQRVMSRIGDIWDAEAALIPLDTTPDGVDLNNKADQIEAQLETHLACLALAGEVDYHVDLEWLGWETEPMVFFYHPDHLGSSSFITGATGEPTQHLEYLPFGELFIEERSTWNTPYKFSGKELDDETGYSYFGARYYDPNISIWLSVDPMADQRSWVSPYSYCQNNPLNRVDPTGALDWIPPSNGSGNWTAEAGDSPGSLATQAGISQSEAEAAVKSANQTRGQARTIETMVYKDDVVNVASRPGYTWSSGSSATTPSTPSSASNNPGSSGNTAQTVNTVATVGGLVTGATHQIAKIPSVGYNIAYNTTLLKGVDYLKPVGYWAIGASFVSDVYLSSTGQQSLVETVTNTAVSGVALGVGGWPGLIIQANYQARKAYTKALIDNPDWAPYPSIGFRH